MPIELGASVAVIMRDELDRKTCGVRDVNEILEPKIPSIHRAGKVVVAGKTAGG